MPSLRVYDTKGNEHSPTGDAGRTNDRVKDLFYDGVRLAVETGRETTFTTFLRARETRNARTEQFYAVYTTRDGSITEFMRALRDRVESEWGYAIDDSADDMSVFRALDVGATSLPGSDRDRSVLTELVGSREGATVGVRDAEHALGLVSDLMGQYDRAAIADSPESSALSAFDLVVTPDGSRGIVPLGDTEDRWESTKESLRSQHIDQEIASINDSVQTLSREYGLSSSEIRDRVTQRVPALSPPRAGGTRADSLASSGSSSRFDLETLGKYAMIGALVLIVLLAGAWGAMQFGLVDLGGGGGGGVSVSGTVNGADGPLSANATVELEPAEGDAMDTTAEGGTFNFSDIPPGNYTLSVETNRFAYDDREIEVTEDGADEVTIEPDRGIVTGEVTADGNPVDATVELVDESGETVAETTDSEFELEAPVDGSYTLRVNAEGYDQVERSVGFGEESVALESSSETTETTGSLSGEVIDTTSFDPIEGATVEAVDADFSATTDSNGTYEINEIPTGEYTIAVSADGYAATERTVEITTEGVEEEFELGAPASVSGVVHVENNESNTLNNATLTLLDSDGEEVETVTTGSDGAYTFDSLEEGGYRIEVSREGYQNETVRPINLDPDQDLTRDITLSPA